ncbi:MAG: leucine-rich repeat domain-containing protein, partial [Bacteroidales bacterium]|nr:leucine-rich repeat domain-containing protein [Bacteroidales bacterium]
TFSGCSGLTSITIGNSVTSIGAYTFYDCRGLTSITIGNSVTSIASNAFYDFSGLTILNWNAKNYINASSSNTLFSNLQNLTTLNIGDSVEIIPSYFVNGCSGLTSITIPNSVTSIGDYAFDSCINLNYIYLGEHIEIIGECAFRNLSNLDTLRIQASLPPFVQAAGFNGVNSDATLVVPCGRMAYYQYGYGWSNFVDIIEDCNTDDTTSALVDVYDDKKIMVYPNPIINNATLSIDNLATDIQVFLTDMQGRIIKSYVMKSGKSTLEIETNNLKSGTYFIRIVGENIQRTEKIFKK